eukprot:CAMPEP_0119193186 /NCGR_PEP_ID=MMETSP1316-20130426/3445_1 /TAXON_ID=41880 /ORGANISM="Pycnococcus provasolii, Strain RCC2336" /LENGTH=243 /DNA_ID=CAMNT_0007188439 /DNA_START=26 /DNA_END=759 /DNA_ORIENTATION=-
MSGNPTAAFDVCSSSSASSSASSKITACQLSKLFQRFHQIADTATSGGRRAFVVFSSNQLGICERHQTAERAEIQATSSTSWRLTSSEVSRVNQVEGRRSHTRLALSWSANNACKTSTGLRQMCTQLVQLELVPLSPLSQRLKIRESMRDELQLLRWCRPDLVQAPQPRQRNDAIFIQHDECCARRRYRTSGLCVLSYYRTVRRPSSSSFMAEDTPPVSSWLMANVKPHVHICTSAPFILVFA